MGVIVGNWIGTLTVYFVLLGYRRYQLGLEFDRKLFRAMNRFGMPLVPAQLAIWTINFVDRLFIATFKGQAEVGYYSIGVRIASATLLLLTAFGWRGRRSRTRSRTRTRPAAPTATCSRTSFSSPAGSR
jgi:O-antigen/teichoic acid export membrane protein